MGLPGAKDEELVLQFASMCLVWKGVWQWLVWLRAAGGSQVGLWWGPEWLVVGNMSVEADGFRGFHRAGLVQLSNRQCKILHM